MMQFSLLIKPTSADCNLHCSYCFYSDKTNLYPETHNHRMSNEVLKHLIASYLQTDQLQYAFNWQGGEPTLLGVDFFRRAVDLQMKFAKPGSRIANGLQTNGTLLNDGFVKFITEYKFLVGISIDGQSKLHNAYRLDGRGKGSHSSVIKGLDCLQRNGAEYNVLTLINTANVAHGKKVFRYLRDLGAAYHQYIPCVEFDDDGSPLPWTITGEQWGVFLCDLFDEWKETYPHTVSVRLFDAILAYLITGKKEICHMDDNCQKYFVVEYNGDVYPCDFFVSKEWRLGNILTDDWDSMVGCEKYREFGQMKTQFHNDCVSCNALAFCMGDCLKHRFRGKSLYMEKSFLCEGWKAFYEYAIPYLKEIAWNIVAEKRFA